VLHKAAAQVVGTPEPEVRPQTPEEMAMTDARRAAATAAVQAAYRLGLAAAATNPMAVAVLELHRPSDDGRWCEGCDGGPDDSGEWPCRTTLTVGRLLGVEIPDDPWSDGYLAKTEGT
jgi:hypothetical protein